MGIDEVSSVFLYLGTGLLLDGRRFFGWTSFEEEEVYFCFGFKWGLLIDLNHVCRAFNEHTGVCPFPATGTRVRDI